MSTTPKSLGEALAEARQAAGLTLAEAAFELSVDRTTLYRWENGQRRPNRFAEPVLRNAVDRWTRRAAKK